MVFKKIEDGNGGRWIIKKKFTFAAVAGMAMIVFATHGMIMAGTPELVVTVLTAFGAEARWLLGIVFAADIADKFWNGGKYEDQPVPKPQ